MKLKSDKWAEEGGRENCRSSKKKNEKKKNIGEKFLVARTGVKDFQFLEL